MSVIELPGARRPTTAFVLGGGGNLGAVQVGMLRAVVERGIVPDVVVGCSVGAINGAALAADPTPSGVRALGEAWSRLDGSEVCPPGRLTHLRFLNRRTPSMVDNRGLRRLLESWLAARRFEELSLPLHVVATSLRTGREQWFASGPLIDPVLASAALPAVFPPVAIGGGLFVDGGVVDNVPMAKAEALGAERVFVFHVGNFAKDRPDPRRPIDVLLQSFSIARSHRYRTEVEDLAGRVEVVALPAIDPGPLRYNDFSRSRELVERAHAASSAFLAQEPAARAAAARAASATSVSVGP